MNIPTPNSLPSASPDAVDPNSAAEQRDLSGQFARVAMRPVGDVDAARRALDATRRAASESPNAPLDPDPRPGAQVDLTNGSQSQQAGKLTEALRRGA